MSKFRLYHEVFIEQFETYQKGSYRNKCIVLGAAGPERLSIPLRKGKHQGMHIRDVRISHASNWQLYHWRSIQTAYGKAPFFEHFGEPLKEIIFRGHSFLFDLNLELLDWLLNSIQLNPYNLSPGWEKEPPQTDLRNTVRYKGAIEDRSFKPLPYHQQFADRLDFVPNLSIIDALFAFGPETRSYIDRCTIPAS